MSQTLPTDSTSSSLIARVKRRDGHAWRRLTEQYGPLVYFWLRQYDLAPQDAADVFQEVFAAVAAKINQFEPRPGGFRGWLLAITRNKANDHFRRVAAQPAAPDGGTAAQIALNQVPDSAPEPPSASDETGEAGQHAQAALLKRVVQSIRAEFEERTWQAFWQVVIDGRQTADVAADLGVAANTVRQYKSRVLRRLWEELGETS